MYSKNVYYTHYIQNNIHNWIDPDNSIEKCNNYQPSKMWQNYFDTWILLLYLLRTARGRGRSHLVLIWSGRLQVAHRRTEICAHIQIHAYTYKNSKYSSSNKVVQTLLLEEYCIFFCKCFVVSLPCAVLLCRCQYAVIHWHGRGGWHCTLYRLAYGHHDRLLVLLLHHRLGFISYGHLR